MIIFTLNDKCSSYFSSISACISFLTLTLLWLYLFSKVLGRWLIVMWVNFDSQEIHNVGNSITWVYCPALVESIIVQTEDSALALNQEEEKKILSVQYLIQIAQTLPTVFLPPILQWFLDRKGFMDWSTTVWSQGYGRASHVSSHHLTLQLLQFMPRLTPLLHPDTQTVSVPVAVLHSTINILIAVLFRLLGQALYFQKEPGLSADLSICRNRAIIHESHY